MHPQIAELAVSVHNNPGVYAVLLGSGVSRGAGLPTAWEVLERLIQQLAVASGEEAPENPAVWYREKFKEEADYSTVVEALGRTPAVQRPLISPFLTATPAEKEEGLKQPSKAHHAIASLCTSEHLRMILTTNFDQLMEQALSEAGVDYRVIVTAEDLAAQPSYVHGNVYVVKINGDIDGDRVRNSEADLSQYDPRWSAFLTEIFDRFGLIVCGWSADYDHALRSAILETPNRRYPLFWSAYSPPGKQAKALIQHRNGVEVQNLDADAFFQQLEGRVIALRDLAWVPPRDLGALSAEVKRLMANPTLYGARLTDLIEATCDDLHQTIRTPETLPGGSDFQTNLSWVVNVTSPLLNVIGTLMKYDRAGEWTAVLREALTRIDWDVRMTGASTTDLSTERQLRRLPLLLVAMAIAGLGAAYDKPEMLTFLQEDSYRERHPHEYKYSAIEALFRSASLTEKMPSGHDPVPVRFWAVETLQRALAPYLHPATAREDLMVGEILIAIVALDRVAVTRSTPLPVQVDPKMAVRGTHLYALSPQRAQTRLFALFDPGLKRMSERLNVVDRKLLADAYDRAAPAAVNPNRDYTTGFRVMEGLLAFA